MSKVISAAIFDFDGLLVDIEGMFDEVVQRYAMEMTGDEIPEPNFSDLRRGMLGRKKKESEALLYAELGLEPELMVEENKYLVWRQPILRDMFVEAQLLPGAKEAVEQLERAGLPMAIATSSTREDLELKTVRHSWLLEKFVVIVTGDQVEHGKPDPELFERAASQLNRPLSDCVVFEDATNGVEAALNGGAGLVIAVPDKRAEKHAFQDLQGGGREGQVVILDSLTEFSAEDYQVDV